MLTPAEEAQRERERESERQRGTPVDPSVKRLPGSGRLAENS